MRTNLLLCLLKCFYGNTCILWLGIFSEKKEKIYSYVATNLRYDILLSYYVWVEVLVPMNLLATAERMHWPDVDQPSNFPINSLIGSPFNNMWHLN